MHMHLCSWDTPTQPMHDNMHDNHAYVQDGNEKDPERRALTTNSLSFLHRPTGMHAKPMVDSRGEDSDSAVDSDSDAGGEEGFVIYSKPRKPSDCVTHKVAMPRLPELSSGLSNFALPSPRGWGTPRGTPAEDPRDQELSTASLNAFAAKPEFDEFDTVMTDAGLDDILGENLLGTGTLPMPLNRMTRSHPKSYAVSPQGSTTSSADKNELESTPARPKAKPHACNGRTNCAECRRGSLDLPPIGTVASKNKYFSRKAPGGPPAPPNPMRTIFNSSGVAVGKSAATVHTSSGVAVNSQISGGPSAAAAAAAATGSDANTKRASPPRPLRPKSNTPLTKLANSVLRNGKDKETSHSKAWA